MKRLVSNTFILIILLSSLTSQAQELKTLNNMIGGSMRIFSDISEEEISFSPTSPGSITINNNFKLSSFFLNPYIAKQINSSNMLGAQFLYNRSRREFDTSSSFSNSVSNGFGLGLFYRRYFFASQSFNFFLQPSINFRHDVSRIEQAAPAFENAKENIYSAGLSLNVSYTIEKWNIFSRLLSTDYTYSKSRNASQGSATTSNNFSLRSAFTNFIFGVERRF